MEHVEKKTVGFFVCIYLMVCLFVSFFPPPNETISFPFEGKETNSISPFRVLNHFVIFKLYPMAQQFLPF